MGAEETTPDRRRPARPGEGERLAAISNLVVKIFADHMGRGPTKVRSYIVEDVVVCLLEDTMTKAELELIGSGHEPIVLETRTVFQHTMRRELIEGIEALVERRVIACMSGNDIDADISSQIFVLGGLGGREPRGA